MQIKIEKATFRHKNLLFVLLRLNQVKEEIISHHATLKTFSCSSCLRYIHDVLWRYFRWQYETTFHI